VEQARRFTLQQLEAIYRNLLETDFAIKMGRVSDALALDLLVAGLSA
jgi:DNA polymerase III delta subunit